MKELLLNPVKSAPDERYCDWISIGGKGESVRCTNEPMFRSIRNNWKLCPKHRYKFGALQSWEPIQK